MRTVNFQMFKLVLEKAEESEIKLPTYTGSWKKQESSRKTSISALLTMSKLLTVWITINYAKSRQSCPTLCDPMDGSPLGSSVSGILQARVLEWGATAFSENTTTVQTILEKFLAKK